MRAILVGVMMLTVLLPNFAEAKVIFNWNGTNAIDNSKRIGAEKRFSIAAAKYLTDKYAALGPYDFVNSPEIFNVMVLDGYEKDNEAKAEYFPGVKGGTLFADPSFLDNLNVFQVGALHELCHAYDYIMTDRMRKDLRFFLNVRRQVSGVQNTKAWYRNYLLKNEQRAFFKEEMYIDELKGELSADEYYRVRKHVNDGKRAHGIRDE